MTTPPDDIFDAIRRAAASEDRRVRVDWADVDVDFLASDMIGKLVQANKLAKELDVDVVIANASPNMLEVFRITRLNKVFTIKFE